MTGAARAAMVVVAALLLPACNLTYVPDQPLPPGGSSGPPFALVIPLNGELQAIANPQFAWNAYPGTLNYQLEISTASDFSVPIWNDPSLTITSTFLTQVTLTNFTTFFWRVYALLPGGSRVLAGGSPYQFRTQGGGFTTPLSFSTLSPNMAVIGMPWMPSFAWQGSIGADSYTLEIDTDGTFSSPAVSVPGIHVNRYTLTTPLTPNTQYFWRVLAVGQLGNRYSNAPLSAFQTSP
jgi:hypothetical protein